MKDPHIRVYQSLFHKSLINPFQNHPSAYVERVVIVIHESNVLNISSHGA